MTDVTLALLADVHGNRWALEAVLDDLARRRVDVVANLGDHLYGPLDPAGTARLLMQLDAVSIRGNQDRALVEPAPALPPDSTYAFVQGALSDAHRAWLVAQPPSAVVEGIFLCHGTPAADDAYLAERVHPGGVALRSEEEMERMMEGVAADVVCCGHSHVPRLLRAGPRTIVNPGSVGLPAYTDDAPCPHAMESGSPHARYALLRLRGGGVQVEHVACAYDWTSAARRARELGRADWAHALLTGRAG